MVCWKANWWDLDEKPTKYFPNLERHNFKKKTIHRVRVENKIYQEAKEVEKEITNFYQKLYKSDESELTGNYDYLEKLQTDKLSGEEQVILSWDIMVSEVGMALRHLSSGKLPGVDLSTEWMEMFWGKLKYFITDVYILTLNAIKSAISKIWVSWWKENPKVDQSPTRWELIQKIKNHTKINYWKLISKKQPEVQ